MLQYKMTAQQQTLQIPPEALFMRIRALCDTGKYLSALALIDLVADYKEKREWKHPSAALLFSYRGLCYLHKKNYRGEAVEICKIAAAMEFFNPDCFLNLGRVYLAHGNRKEAYKAFRKGLMIDPKNATIQREIRLMGARKNPVFTFLSRDHFLNRFFGKWRHKLNRRSQG